MVKTEFHEIWLSINITTFINKNYVELVSMMEGELDEGIDQLYWWNSLSCWIAKEVTGGGISNG